MNKPKRYERVFWVELHKIKPNPMQPRREFDDERLRDLAESIRQYGVLQPIVVIKKEIENPSGVAVEYELITGERRLRASKVAGLSQIPVVIQDDMENKIKLELAIIENLQREDLNPIERARAFKQLIDEFNLRHHEVASRVGKSREYVTNTVRLISLPEEIQASLMKGEISEGHCRPLLMLIDRKEEQSQLFRDIIEKKINVREAERISRGIAVERARKRKEKFQEVGLHSAGDPEIEVEIDPETQILEKKLSDTLGANVKIERMGGKGRIYIDFFSDEELQALLGRVLSEREISESEALEKRMEELNEESFTL